MTSLRPYQLLAVGMAREHLRDRPILRLDTGAGKTVIAAEIMRLADAKGRRTIFLCDRREIVKQTAARLNEAGVRAGAILSREPATDAPHQVAAVQTLIRRAHHPADLAIADECRLSMATTYRTVLERYPARIGLDATPLRQDGKGLHALFGTILEPVTTEDLVAGGWLAPYRMWSAPFDPRGIDKAHGDYAPESAARAMSERHVVGDVVATYAKHGAPGTFLLFACTVAHSLAMRDAFRAAGYLAEHLDAKSADRDEVLDSLRARGVQVLCNVGLFGYGTDVPNLDGVILCRPTCSLALYRQQVGRARRPKPGGRHAIILDHAGNLLRHGAPDWPVAWSLDDHATRVYAQAGEAVVARCAQCSCAFHPRLDACPECGAPREASCVRVVSHDGDLVEVDHASLRPPPASMEQKRSRFRELLEIAHLRGYRKGWCANAYRREFGVWPVTMRELVAVELARCPDPGTCTFCESVFEAAQEFAR